MSAREALSWSRRALQEALERLAETRTLRSP